MLKSFSYILILLATLLTTGCESVLTAAETAPKINTVNKAQPLTIAILDHRPYVVNNDKSPAFEGLIRSAFGIPYSYDTVTKEAMSNFLGQRLALGIKRHGVDVDLVQTHPAMTVDASLKAVNKKENTGLLFVLKEWKYDLHPLADNSWYDLDVMVIDKIGNKKLVKNFKGENDIPEELSIFNDMQIIYKQRFEQIFQDPDVRNALK
ncbi:MULTISPECIES: hypothetical protein [unclassified Photobacterium]|uniref:hypothetical protein n=1 Tax=unclassified Photobacterium TaxID=2628852 RepID=UPI001EDDC56E|nr:MULTISPECIES: hypothetical protein [unclassified Photobacterium]MCG3865233.1 hypothetical protein [Photobacterium sp. Ph6]MCG3876734.1 hypothetical protein [Photobacterium sp. Ph5]